MSNTIIAVHPHAVKHQRFIAATEQDQERLERQIGRNYYRRGYDLDACTTDEMAVGWLACEAAGERFGWQRSEAVRGEMAYHAEMQRQASATKFVNWNSGAEVW